jgi:hypothetical protein
MSDVMDSVYRVLQNSQHIEASSFYKEHQEFSKEYEALIQKGITRRRESQLKTFDQNNIPAFSYNINP